VAAGGVHAEPPERLRAGVHRAQRGKVRRRGRGFGGGGRLCGLSFSEPSVCMVDLENATPLTPHPTPTPPRFDLKRLGSWLAHLGLTVPRGWSFVDTLVLATDVAERSLGGVPGARDLKLQTLREAMGIPAPERVHRWAGEGARWWGGWLSCARDRLDVVWREGDR
jgi:hypothetical protein